MAFKKPPMGKRGYDEEDVDAFLDEVEQELIRLREENDFLHDRAQRGAPGGSRPASPTVEIVELAAQLEQVQAARARAEEQARALRARLEQARHAVPAGPAADDRISPVLAMAQRTADNHLREAESTAASLLSDYRAKATQLVNEAQLKAAALENDARRRHTESIDNIQVERATLLERIDQLTRLAQSYRIALESHITQQLDEVNSAPPQP
jgi:DivIVA domain-containing protein